MHRYDAAQNNMAKRKKSKIKATPTIPPEKPWHEYLWVRLSAVVAAIFAFLEPVMNLSHGKFVLKESERRELSFLSFASSQRPDEC